MIIPPNRSSGGWLLCDGSSILRDRQRPVVLAVDVGEAVERDVLAAEIRVADHKFGGIRDLQGIAELVRLVKAMVLPMVMYGCGSWTVKKAERRRINAFDCGVGEDS